MVPLSSPSATLHPGYTTFTYKAFDGLAYSGVTTVTLTMRNTNQPPTNLALAPTDWDENKAYVGALTSTDADFGAPFEAFTYELVSGPGSDNNGDFRISGSQLLADPFNYEVKTSYNVRIRTTDLFGEYFEKAFIIMVKDVNDAPVADDQEVLTYKDQSKEIILTGSDEDGDPIDFAIFTEASQHGSLDSIGTGSIITTENGILRLIAPNVTYTPDDGYVGLDSFTFKVRDPEGAVSVEPATVSIMVNDIPVAQDDSFDATEDIQLAIEEPGVLANDVNDLELEELVAVLVDGPSHGELVLSPDGAFTYMPVANYNGVDTFTYKACEGSDCSNIATVTINIAAVNDAPVANDMSVETDEDTTKWIETS